MPEGYRWLRHVERAISETEKAKKTETIFYLYLHLGTATVFALLEIASAIRDRGAA